MESNWTQNLFFPTLTGVIILAIEYFVVQPWLRFRESKLPQVEDVSLNSDVRKWSSRIRNAIKEFKQHYPTYKWEGFSLKSNFVEISEFSTSRDQTDVILAVNVRYLFDKPREIAQYKLVINRVGDISKLETIYAGGNPFAADGIPFPGSWLIIAAVVFVIYLASAPSQPPVTENTINSTPVAILWPQATPILVNSSINGTLGGNEVDTYLLKSETNQVLAVTVNPIDAFTCYLSIYNQNNSVVRREFIASSFKNIQIAPELNANYLIVITPANEGGSYTLNLYILQTPTP